MSKKLFWKAIIDEKELQCPPLETMIVGRVKDRCQTSQILPQLSEIYHWPQSLKHVRRLNQFNEQLDILLYPQSHLIDHQTKDFIDKYFHRDQIRSIEIPLKPFLYKCQYDQFVNKYWTNIAFRQNPLLEKSIENKDLTEKDQSILQLFQVKQFEVNIFVTTLIS